MSDDSQLPSRVLYVITDTLALGLITEGIGLGIPIVALPFLNAAQAAHPTFGRHVDMLRAAGAAVLLGTEGYEPHVPHQGSKNLHKYPWQAALDAVEVAAQVRAVYDH